MTPNHYQSIFLKHAQFSLLARPVLAFNLMALVGNLAARIRELK